MNSRGGMSTGQNAGPDDEFSLPRTEEENCPENPLYLNPEFSDVIFVVGGEELHAHKAFLAPKSKHFFRLFKENCDKKEITISNTSPASFRLLLKYIYTDIIAIPSDTAQMLQLLILAHEHSFGPLESQIIEKIKTILDVNNLISFVNEASEHDLDDLRDICYAFIDANALPFLTSDSFSNLSQRSLIQILKRDHRLAPEVVIFKSVARWCEKNNSNVVLECVRLSLLTQSEITFVVRPTKLVSLKKVLETISEISRADSKNSGEGKLLSGNPKNLGEALEENIATVQNGARVISHGDANNNILLTGNTEYVKHTIGEKSGITVRLHKPCSFNHIRMKLHDASRWRYYSYYIETSLDEKIWHRIVDYSSYPCRSVQNLYFHPQVSQFIKVVGTSTTAEDNDFRLVSFEAFCRSDIPRMQNGIICPEANVATPDKGATVLGGEGPQNLLDGNIINSATSHRISSNQSDSIIVQLAQPYVISSMRLLLFPHYNHKYFIETSVNKRDWQVAIDRRNGEFRGWQDLQFAERVVVFIKITGTYNSHLTVILSLVPTLKIFLIGICLGLVVAEF